MQKAGHRAQPFLLVGLGQSGQNLKQIWIATDQSRFSSLRHFLEHCADPCSDFGKSRSKKVAQPVFQILRVRL
jgi:hypothetical protein